MPFLVLNAGLPDEQRFPLKPGLTSIGRAIDNDIVVVHSKLSRRHATIETSGSRAVLTDLQSRNGTFVNDAKVTHQVELHDGDVIRCAEVGLKFVDERMAPRAATTTATGTGSGMDDLLVPSGETVLGSALRLKEKSPATRSADQLRVLLKVSELLSSPKRIDEVLDDTLTLLLAIMQVDRGVIHLLDESSGAIELAASKVAPGVDPNRPLSSQHIVRHVLEKSAGVLSTDAVADPRFAGSESICDQSIRSSMCVPLRSRDRVLGVLYVDNLMRADLFNNDDMEFLAGFANQAAVAIDNSRLYRKIEEEAVARNKLLRFFPPSVSNKLMESKDISLAPVELDVTVLFSDICSFTEMSSHMEPRHIVELLNEYFSEMARIVFQNGGTLEKYIGDALMAIWGAPFPDPFEADRASRAAVDMQRALDHLNARWSTEGRPRIQVHIGLNSGKVAAGNIGSADYIQYAAIGDTTNVASRICSAAQAGEILLSRETFAKLVDTSLPVEPLPPVYVKGKAEPLTLYRLVWDRILTDVTSRMGRPPEV